MTTDPCPRSRARRSATAIAAATVLLSVTAGCGEPASAVYRDAAVKALEGGVSEARTVELAGRLWVDDLATAAFASVTVRAGEKGVGEDTAWFGDQQPPEDADDTTRRQALDALAAMAAAVEDLRVALDRGDRAAVGDSLEQLRTTTRDAQDLAGRLS